MFVQLIIYPPGITKSTAFVTYLVCILLFTSCQPATKENYSHPQYFDPVFSKAERMKSSDPKQALVYLDSAFSAFPHAGIKDLFRKYIFTDGRLVEKGQYAEALVYCDSALWLIRNHAKEKEFVASYGDALFNKGYLLIALKRYPEAFDCNYKARQIVEKTGDTCSLSAYTLMLGAVSNLQGKYLDAARYTKQGVGELGYCPDSYDHFKLVGSKLDDTGIFYSRQGMPDSALHYFNATLNYFKQYKQPYLHIPDCAKFVEIYSGVVYGNMGTAYIQKGDTATAERLFKESLRINTQKGVDQGDAQFTWLKLAGLYLAQKRFAETGEMLRQLRHSLDTLPGPAKEVKWYRLQLEYLGKIGQTQNAWPYIAPYLKLSDSLATIKPIPQVNVNKEYEHLKNEYNLMLLEKRDQHKTIYLVIVIAFAILAIAVAFFLWHNWKKSKRLNERIQEHNVQMQKTLRALEQSQADNTRMMQIVAHDLRNPIGGMTMIASLMLQGMYRSVEDREMLQLIKTSGDNSLELVNDLLQVHIRTEEMKKEPVDLKAMLRYCVELLYLKAEAKGQHINLQAAAVTLSVNREKLWRVVSNLVANAIKFSATGAVIDVKLETNSDSVLIAVEDHGIGIPVEMKDKIFDMFTEAKRPGTAGEQPFGLGLAISKQIIETHGGKIWFESNPGRGTTFYVELPVS